MCYWGLRKGGHKIFETVIAKKCSHLTKTIILQFQKFSETCAKKIQRKPNQGKL